MKGAPLLAKLIGAMVCWTYVVCSFGWAPLGILVAIAVSTEVVAALVAS